MRIQHVARSLIAATLLHVALLPVAHGQVVPTPPIPARQTPDTAAARRAVQQQLGRNVSRAEILEQIRKSGLNRSQIRTRLQQAGYDPGLADSYLDMIDRGGEPPTGDAPVAFQQALERIGVMLPPEVMDPDSALALERERRLAEALTGEDTEVFGVRTFRRSGMQFRPLAYGPVDPGYRVGPGDEISLVLTGDVEAAYPLPVTREGDIFIPDVGRVNVNGLTLAQLEDVLYSRLGRVYSGVTRSPNATTRFQVSLGRLRANQVYVRGEVLVPDAIQVSSVAGAFNALYQVGGPTEQGTFRRVEVHRGGTLASTIDLYDFLIGGSVSADVRLENNDHIFVPPAGVQVRVTGAVRRPAVYELLPHEGLKELLNFAGGLRSDAFGRRLQIDRILPPEEQRPGSYRTIVNVELLPLLRGERSEPLKDGDQVYVFSVSDEQRNRIYLGGEVMNPGLYEWREGLTLWGAVQRADGLGERAYTSRAHIYRMVPSDGSRQLLPVSLELDQTGRPTNDVPLADLDSVVIHSRQELRTPELVTIDGFVKRAATYDLARGMTLKDLILKAGGFIDGAYAAEAELSRQLDPYVRGDTTAKIIRVSLGSNGGDTGDNGILPHWTPEAGELQLRHGDRVFIRRAPGHGDARLVKVTGEVHAPGTYVLTTRDERFSELLQRAGGLTSEAHPLGIHVVREGRIVAGDLERALRRPGDRNNIVLMAGDSIHVPALDPMVVVSGAVNFEASVLFEPGRSIDYYVRQAGGYAADADRRRTTITYPNGERNAFRPRLAGLSSPRVHPGSQIFVPAKPENSGANWDQIITRGAAILSATATLLVVIQQLR